jgi:6-hydroxynicotinate 3-monooxygenase
MPSATPYIAIIGAGIGGLTAAAALRQNGIAVHIFEQASRFARVGAGIQQSPNAVKVLRRLGLEEQLKQAAFRPTVFHSRDGATGEITAQVALGQEVEARLGAPYLLMHRGDLHALLAANIPQELISLDKKLVGLDRSGAGVTLTFADGSKVRADAVIGADGVHSVVRQILFGDQPLRFTGRVGYRTTFPAHLLNGRTIDPNAKWWGPDRHIVIYYTKPGREEMYFVTATPEPDFEVESWSAKGDLRVLRDAYSGFHPDVRGVLDCCPEVHKWALVERDPLPRWSDGPVVLLGDACHAMTPWMAQGAAISMEDAAVLARCVDGVEPEGWGAAFRRYEATRIERASAIQRLSGTNTFLRSNSNADWVYGYDAWTTPLA